MVCLIWNFKKPNFTRGDYKTYLEVIENKKISKLAIMGEFLYGMVNLPSAISFLLYLFLDLFYDTEHQDDWPYQNKLMFSLIITGAFFGGFSVFNQHVQKIVRSLEAAINGIFFPTMFFTSLVDCLNSDWMNGEGFKNAGSIFTTFILFFSLVLSIRAAKCNYNFTYRSSTSEINIPESVSDNETSCRSRFSFCGQRMTNCVSSLFSACGRGIKTLVGSVTSCKKKMTEIKFNCA